MGQAPPCRCCEHASRKDSSTFCVVWSCRSLATEDAWGGSAASTARRGPRSAGGGPRDSEEQRLLARLPRELAEELRETGHWTVLRCRPWLSAGALWGLQQRLRSCELRQLAEWQGEAETPGVCDYSVPTTVPWVELHRDHVVSAGQVFRLDAIPDPLRRTLNRTGFEVLRQGKCAVALLAGGANLRLGLGEPPVGCSRRTLRLPSGKSILQLCCERVRRIAALCSKGPTGSDRQRGRLAVPVLVMTSRLTHRRVVGHFEASDYFGLHQQDVFFFEQPVHPVLGHNGQLLPQSLGGEFAHAPGGTGPVLRALADSSALEQLRDRGVDFLHIVGTENVLAKVCDPVFIGFCQFLDLECACKVVDRADKEEDLELFCVRRNPVSSRHAGPEEAACGVEAAQVPDFGRRLLSPAGVPDGCASLGASINSVVMSLEYMESVVGRPVRHRRAARAVPYLDFYACLGDETPEAAAGAGQRLLQEATQDDVGAEHVQAPERLPAPASAVAPMSWPLQATSQDLACQRALMAAAGEVHARLEPSTCHLSATWRCDVDLDCAGAGALAPARVCGARPGPALLPMSLQGPGGAAAAFLGETAGAPLRCSLVVPRAPNAWVLETSVLDYFAYAERAVALHVASRASEFAPVREPAGQHSPHVARGSLHLLHCRWLERLGVVIEAGHGPDALLEVSPLLSYQGEGFSERNLVQLLPGRPPEPPGSVGSKVHGEWLSAEEGSEVARPRISREACAWPDAQRYHLRLPCHLRDAGEPPGSCDAPRVDMTQLPAEEALDCMDERPPTSREATDMPDTRPYYLQEYPRRPEVSCSCSPRFRGGPSAPVAAPRGVTGWDGL
uniref:UDP-N-acetylglucosamine diphosphorylase n=1 Tax=Alexandrium monilatum TaxID=311494 RepID=A0A7S4QMS6_9DINO|mmetsp:Transcript_51843/g.154861  ORF Transcript_51843/g.154861 Transcript_51843/m.154861 type:complete len:844 (-) Transcript_51843:66-2597(-)